MRLGAIFASRVTYLMELSELVPEGKLFPPSLVAAIANAGQFRKFPQDVGAETKQANLVFEMGQWKEQPITKLSLFADGIAMDTSSSTEDTDAALGDMLLWANKELGIQFEPKALKRKIYFSQLIAYFDVTLDDLHPVLDHIAESVTKTASDGARLPMLYRTDAIRLSVNPLTAKYPTGIFSIERRAESLDSENKYFCSAPLQTAQHLALIESFEKALKGKLRRS